MPDHKVYRDENGDYLIRASGTNNFFVHTTDGGGGGGSTPGLVSSFTVTADFINNTSPCTPSNSFTFDWTAPSSDGGSPITGYKLRRLSADWNGSNFVAGIPSLEFDYPCGSLANLPNPFDVGNVLTYTHNDWACDYYYFDVAAVNANGTGPYKTSASVISQGSAGYEYTIGGGNINISYFSYQGNCPYVNFQAVTAKLYAWGGSNSPANQVGSTYTAYTPGSVTFTQPAAGTYFVEIEETWTDYTNSCSEDRHGCLRSPIKVP